VEKAYFPVTVLCRMLRVSPAGYDAWRTRPESKRSKEDRRLSVLVRAAHEAGRCYDGSPRVHRELRAQGISVGRTRVIRLMQAQSLVARTRKRFTGTTVAETGNPVASNLLDRDFTAPAPNTRWVGEPHLCS
jgi:transposase InsO family protein